MKEAFIKNRINLEGRARIDTINAVIADYQAQGMQLTLRQLYYQLVSRNVLPNTERSYKNLGPVVKGAAALVKPPPLDPPS